MIRNKCDNIFQWDTNLILDVPASDIVYVDFQHDEIIRVAVEDGSCRIPDEILETAGKKILWLCHDDQTREQFIFNVKARPMPPDHITTPTQRITFDSLVRDVRTSIEEADIALGAMMASVEREVGDKMSSVDEKMQQVDEDVSDALESVQEATERAEDASEGAERVNIESERVADGVMVKTTDREGHQTVTMVHDGQGGEGGSGMVEHKLTYTGSAIQFNGVTQTFTQVKDACLDPEKFVFVVYQNRLYIPQYVYNDRIFFTCTYQTDASGVQTRRIKMSSNGAISVDDVELATSDELSGKLEKPSSGIAVGKYFRVASIDDAGNPVLEAVDLPIADVNVDGVLKIDPFYGFQLSATRKLTILKASNAEIEARTNQYRPITPYNLRPAVDSVLCSDKESEALTDAQKTAFWNRVEKEWVLKGTITTENKDTGVAVDLTGCTELTIVGTVVATGTSSLITDKYNLIYNAALSGTANRTLYATFKDSFFGFEAVAKTENNTNGHYVTDLRSGYTYFGGEHIASASLIKWNQPGSITTCNLKIYAR